jgi:hypothetical protein
MLRGVTLIHSLFEQEGAALLYDCDTAPPAGVIRTAEFFATKNGKITKIRLVFDAKELRKLMQLGNLRVPPALACGPLVR